jgi:multidrug resistance efflux pump
LHKILANMKHKLNEANAKTSKSTKLIEQSEIKVRLANDKATRLETLNELLAPLSREKKAVMGEMLKDIKTSNLREAFSRYLNAVLNGNNTPSNNGKASLTENVNVRAKSVGMTGDRKNKLNESALDVESIANNSDIASILYLAGIKQV